MYTNGMQMFRDLTEEEEEVFREWARTNYIKGEAVSEIWHPIVRDECAKINKEVEIC